MREFAYCTCTLVLKWKGLGIHDAFEKFGRSFGTLVVNAWQYASRYTTDLKGYSSLVQLWHIRYSFFLFQQQDS